MRTTLGAADRHFRFTFLVSRGADHCGLMPCWLGLAVFLHWLQLAQPFTVAQSSNGVELFCGRTVGEHCVRAHWPTISDVERELCRTYTDIWRQLLWRCSPLAQLPPTLWNLKPEKLFKEGISAALQPFFVLK